MANFRRTPLFLIALLGVTGSANPGRGVAPILPEVKKHLAAAHKYLASGSWEFAAAHADMVLISDDVGVAVKVDGVGESQRRDCMRALDACLDRWEEALGNTVRFHLESDPAKAELTVRFRKDVRMKREPVAGLTNWKRSISTTGGKVTDSSFKADIQVRTLDLDYRPLSYEAMRQEAEHEFGHVLGLEDSSHLGDLMGELDVMNLVSGPREYEILAVRNLRDEAKQLKTDAETRSRGAGRSE